MSIVTFKPAARKGAHVIITAYGESGCGKTLSLLKIGRGLVGPKGRLAMIDTETGRGMIYAGAIPGGYEYGELTPPFTPERYIEAIDAAENELKADALIIDSGSHEWEGLGGILEIADGQKSQKGTPLQGLIKWAKPKARHKQYVQRLLNSRMHLLIALRAKEKMKQLPSGDIVSEGYVPIQDRRFIFETTVQLFLPVYPDRRQLGIPKVEKCPGDLWGAFPDGRHISERTGEMIAEWVAGGSPVDNAHLALKRAAEEAAALGTPALRTHWRGLSLDARAALADQEDNLRSIAADADQQASAHDEPERATERDTPADVARPNSGSADEPPGRPTANGDLSGPDVGGGDLLERTTPLGEAISAELERAATTADVIGIEFSHKAELARLAHDEWLPIQERIDARKAELAG